ncbi:PaaI family thioesterase [Neobacillus sp. SM06]|uniref:PaaI family thioesterase n=1 Tax=Neobacillus sp. SM06 TaxID=3422492 RepID=UPI003D289E1E
MFIRQPFDEFLGFQYERLNKDSIKIVMPIQSLFLNSVGVIHGGIISSLADVALCNTLGATEDGKQKAVTVDLDVTFIKGAKGNKLAAIAKLVKTGRSLSHAECHIYDDQENLVAKAKAILFHTQND